MTVETARVLRIKRHFEVSPERVFDAWLSPESVAKWLFTTATSEITRVEIDARVGGKYLCIDRRNDQDIEHVGEYLEIDRPRRLVFTFAVPKFSPEMTKVTVDIVPAEKGCDLTLTHENVLPEWATQTQQGWGMIFDGLQNTLENPSGSYGTVVDPGTVRLQRVLPGPVERVWSYLTESDKRAQWLASGEIQSRVGSTFALNFDHDSLTKHQEPPPALLQQRSGHFTYTVTEMDPPHRLSMTWGGGTEDQPSEVTFELRAQGDRVLLTLTHRRLATRDTMVDVVAGWHTHLDILVERLNNLEPTRGFWPRFTSLNEEYKRRVPE